MGNRKGIGLKRNLKYLGPLFSLIPTIIVKRNTIKAIPKGKLMELVGAARPGRWPDMGINPE